MKELIIIGASGFGREIAWLVERINQKSPTWRLLGFLDDNEQLKNTIVGGYPVLGKCLQALQYADAYFVCAIGTPKIRKLVIAELEAVLPAPHYATLIDPSVLMSSRVDVGPGSMICAGNIITVDISLGRHTIVNLDCTIGHDAVFQDYVTLCPSVNMSGMTHIGSCVEFGTGTQVLQGKRVCGDVVVGAGAVVNKDITEPGTYVGVPARRLK